MSHPAQLHPLVPLPEEVLALLLRCGGEEQVLRPDELIAAFTRAQAGSVARRQLLAAGLPRNSVDNRLQRRQLIARFRGVYAPGHLNLGIHGHRTAAVLAVSGSLLSHGSATALHGVGGAPGRWHVTVPGAGRRDPNYEIVVHTSTTLRHDEICVVQGLPCTTLTRSIVDAASHLSARQLANVLARAERASSLHLASLRHTLERTRTAPTRGHCTLLSALQEHVGLGAQLTRSDAESALEAIARRAGLPPPLLNRVVAGDEIDALWPDARLGIEIDSWAFHRDRRSFVADRAKLRRLFLRGLIVLPYAAADIVHRPDLVASELRATIARARQLQPAVS